MKTVINGIVITDKMAETLERWYMGQSSGHFPNEAVIKLSKLQDLISIKILEDANNESLAVNKTLLDAIMYIKTELELMILDNEGDIL
ncbi:MAG: hypothetical protein LBN95_07985 [Prevotellaceae bacterium]|jgi:hypothetical protein|nr:hypothetical protein [Prevotellaceae bacterium]